MSFLWPNLLWLLLIVPLLVAAYILMQRRRKKYALRYASLSLVKEAVGRGPGRRRHIPPILFLIAIAALCVGVARPMSTIMMPSLEGTVILTLDVSGSMRADDVKPTRMDAAKEAALAFVEKQPVNVRIGVVSFSDSSALVQAPTTDREAVKGAINRLVTQRGTGIGKGILTSLDAIFEQPGVRPDIASRDPLGAPKATPTYTPLPRGEYAPAIIVLLSDGQNNVAPAPLDIVKQAEDRGVRIYTVGVGSPAGTTLGYMGRYMRVRLDEDTLKAIAEKTDGMYFKADNATDLKQIYEDLSTQLTFKQEETEMTAWFAGGAAALMIVAGFLSMLWFNRLP